MHYCQLIRSSPSVEICACVREINYIFIVINIHIIGEPKWVAFSFSYQWSCQTTSWANNQEPQVCICNIEISGLLIKPKSKWPPTDVLQFWSKWSNTVLPGEITMPSSSKKLELYAKYSSYGHLSAVSIRHLSIHQH